MCRQLEKTHKRILKLLSDIQFLQTCLHQGVVPKFLNLRDPNRILNKQHIKLNQNKKISSLIKQHKHKIKKLRNRRATMFEDIASKRNYFYKLVLIKSLQREGNSFIKEVNHRHRNKLRSLCLREMLKTPSDTVKNLSSYELSNDELQVLKTGLKHPALVRAKDTIDILTQCEKVLYFSSGNVNVQNTEELKHIIVSFQKKIQQQNRQAHQKHVQGVLKNIRKNELIKIVPFDKGQGLAIMDKTEYFQKLHSIVSDESKFKVIEVDENASSTDHPIIKNENKIKYYLNRYVKPYIDESTYSYILPCGSQSGKLYGAAKVHKHNTPLRPIVASYGTAEYNLAKYLNKYITSIIPDQHSVSKNSELLTELNNYHFTSNSKLVSFDIESLFTNVDLKFTIDIAVEKIYAAQNTNRPPFEAKVFRRLLEFATNGLFQFDGKLYQQTDGVAMGSPLAPSLANLFVGEMENRHLNENKTKVKYYTRFVDDVLTIFEQDEVNSFHNFINSWHDNLKFTVEVGGNSIPFLDINIEINNENLCTTVYRKPTYTGLLLNFQAVCPITWKKGLMNTLINRAYNVCSNWHLFHEEMCKLRNIAISNGYPLNFVNKCIEKFLNKCYGTVNDTVKEEVDYDFVFKLPYIGMQSLIVKKQLLKALKTINKDLNIRWVFTTPKIRQMFSLKDKTNLALRSNVVYKFTCSVDPCFSYVGKTKRHLAQRVKEHNNKNSAISQHRINCDCTCNLEDFKILDTARIKEAIHIFRVKPTLNKQLGNDGAFFKCRLL